VDSRLTWYRDTVWIPRKTNNLSTSFSRRKLPLLCQVCGVSGDGDFQFYTQKLGCLVWFFRFHMAALCGVLVDSLLSVHLSTDP
jgi:hypothetical protein